jgi:hypothetical protein
MRTPLLLVLFTSLCLQIRAQQLNVQAETIPQYDNLFARSTGWTGADGDYSIALSYNVTLMKIERPLNQCDKKHSIFIRGCDSTNHDGL